MIFEENATPARAKFSCRGEGSGAGLTDKGAGGNASGQVPQTKGAIPGTGESELTVGRHDNILDEVAVAAHEEAGVTVVLALLAGEVPLQQRLVPRARDEHVHGLLVGVGGEGDGGDPAVVANEGTDLSRGKLGEGRGGGQLSLSIRRALGSAGMMCWQKAGW